MFYLSPSRLTNVNNETKICYYLIVRCCCSCAAPYNVRLLGHLRTGSRCCCSLLLLLLLFLLLLLSRLAPMTNRHRGSCKQK